MYILTIQKFLIEITSLYTYEHSSYIFKNFTRYIKINISKISNRVANDNYLQVVESRGYFSFLHPTISAMLTDTICRVTNITVTNPMMINTFSLSVLLLFSFLEEGMLVAAGLVVDDVSAVFSKSDARSPRFDKQFII